MKALIVDDDLVVAEVAKGLLTAAEFDVQIAEPSGDVLEQVRKSQADVVLLDIMMPGVDGLEVCRQITTHEDLLNIKVVIVSGKAYDFDKRQAKQAGADGYITKPLKAETFAEEIKSITESCMTLTYWGVRGTLPVPGPKSLKYGGNTSCVTITLPNDRTLIFDAGSGIKAFSDHVMKERRGKISAKLFISHPHWDHINAFPFFAPFHVPGNKFEVIGARHGDRTMEDLISAQMDDVFFPILVSDMGAAISFKDLGEETIEIDDDVTVKTMLLSHPGNCLGYRVNFGGKSICYVTDNELYTDESGFRNESYESKLIEFIKGSDILITDTTYFDEDYESKVHWGHSCVGRVIEIAHAAQIKTLHLFHHDPDQFDDDVDRKLLAAKTDLTKRKSATQVIAPAEGMSFKL